MSITCKYCGSIAGKGHEIGHRSDCSTLRKQEYPVTAKNCMEDFMQGEFELICGKRNVYGEWMLCPKCRKLPENQKFLEKPKDKSQLTLKEMINNG